MAGITRSSTIPAEIAIAASAAWVAAAVWIVRRAPTRCGAWATNQPHRMAAAVSERGSRARLRTSRAPARAATGQRSAKPAITIGSAAPISRCHRAGAVAAAASQRDHAQEQHACARLEAATAEALGDSVLPEHAPSLRRHEARRQLCTQRHRERARRSARTGRARGSRAGAAAPSRARWKPAPVRRPRPRTRTARRRWPRRTVGRAGPGCARARGTRLPQPERDAAQHDRQQRDRERREQRGPERGERGRKRREQDRDREDQPDVVRLPQRPDRRGDRLAVRASAAGQAGRGCPRRSPRRRRSRRRSARRPRRTAITRRQAHLTPRPALARAGLPRAWTRFAARSRPSARSGRCRAA